MTSAVVLHPILDSSEWPAPVKGIAQALRRPLPSYLATGPYPFVSPSAASLLRELQVSCGSFLHEDGHFPDERPLTDVLNIVLSTVSEVRELVKLEEHSCPRPTVPLWSTLIKALGHACSNDITVMEEVSFIRPRVAASEQRNLETLDGIATVLLSYVVDSIDCTDPSPNTDEPPNKITADDDDISMQYIERSSTTMSSTLSIDVPFDGHVLPGHGRRFCAVLPLLCVADEENIHVLLSSVLYQRHVWGIDEPVVGIIFSKTGTIGRVILGWLDPQSTDCDKLPTINIACAIADTAPDPALGVFNLTDPTSAFALAQFILGLETHFRTITSATSNPQIRILGWRSDHITIDDRKIGEEQWRSRVAQWAYDTDMCDDSSSEDSSLPRTPSPHELPLGLPVSALTEMSTKPPKPPTRQNPHGKVDVKVTASKKQTESPDSSAIPPGSESQAPSSSPPFSSSSFGRLSAAGLAKMSISTWLFERRTLTMGLIKLPGETPDVQEINGKIDLYHSMTKLLWPAKWSTADALPKVDGGVEEVRQHLFRQYEEIQDKIDRQDVLKPAHVEIFERRFSSLLWATIGAFSFKAASLGRTVFEAEARHDWDAVLYRFCASPQESVSPYVLLERPLRFARNNVADGTDSSEAIMSQRTLATDYLQCSIVQLASYRLPDASARNQALAAVNEANAFSNDLDSLNPADFLDTVKQRAQLEPRTGICDAILVTPVSLGTGQAAEDNAYLKEFGLLNLTPPTQPSVPEKQKPETKKQKPGTKKQKHNAEKQKHDVVPSSSHSLSPPSLPASPNSLSATDKKLLANPLGVVCTGSMSTSAMPILPSPSLLGSDVLLLSGFAVEYKKSADNEAKALNQGRMYVVSAVTYLAALGIKGFAVFGLITSGQKGGIIMAWQSEIEDKIYIIERNIRTFNLSSPLEAFHFASFLIRLQEHTDTLKDLFIKGRDQFLKRLEKGELPQWTKEAQTVVVE